MTRLTVAAAQIECIPGDVGANLALHLAMIEAAQERGVELLVFPELSLSDYVSVPDLQRAALGANSPELDRLAQAAGDMALSIGFVEALAGRYHIAQALIVGGRVVQVHRKINLQTYGNLQEGRHYAGGSRLELAAVSGWTVATLICADLWNPALPWLAALKGSDLMLVPTASALDAVEGDFDNPEGWDLTLRQVALAYGCPSIMANHCGTRGGLRFWGGSRIIDAFGHQIARAGSTPELLVASIDSADALEARKRLPTVRDANPELVEAELAALLGTPPVRASR